MSATDSELTSMEDPHALEDEKGSLTNIPSLVPPATVPSSTPHALDTMRPNFTSETVLETKAVSMASNDCSSALSSPAEASPAKTTVKSPTTFGGTIETSSATSHIASASDSLICTGTSFVNISESTPLLPVLPSTAFGSSDSDTDFPAVLTFKGVSVTLENNSVWKQFNGCGTEMILTKQGRRMFPYCRYRLAGLDPERQYSLVLSIVPSDPYRYRWSTSKWEINGPAEHQTQGLIRAFSHHYSPCQGSDWMGGLVSFYKLKLTNNPQDHEGHIILHSMHRYIPRLHVIPVPDGDVSTLHRPVVMGPESMTFTFPQTEFMAVTTYQNFRITQLKINHNPFAKGFREDGNNSRLNRVNTTTQPVGMTDCQPAALQPAELDENKEKVVDLCTKNYSVSASLSNEPETRLVLKPIMSTTSNRDEPYVPCIRGNHALGELVLVQKRPRLETKEETLATSVTPKVLQVTPKAISVTPTSTTSTPRSSPGYRKKRKRINKHWANSRGREWKAANAHPTVVHSPTLTVAMQPELDDVEGLLFVSFTSKEALEVHITDKPANNSSPVSPVSLKTPMELKHTVEVNPETDEEKIAHLEGVLLQDLRVLKHRQVIHPVLQEVGLKLSSLDPTKYVDLQYLGVHLPLPPPNLPERGIATSPGDEELPFISRTGKTSDITKIKGWRNKFIKKKETSSTNCDGSQKNLSAFCSNMLDEYLESEAQYISERAAAFSTHPEGSVAYQLPAKSSSYVKTLDSVLRHRNTASKFPVGANRPCPLSHKPLLYSALMSPAPALASSVTPVQAGAPSLQQSASSRTQLEPLTVKAASGSSVTSSQRLSIFGQSQGVTHRPTGLTKFQFKLLQMEVGALNQGLSRTQLTQDRLSVALSVMLTKEMLFRQVLRVPQFPKNKTGGPECGQEFCRLGCVCSSLQQLNRGHFHCRRPECMFGCACFKRKIIKQLTAWESEPQIQPVYSMTNMEHVVQPLPGSHANKLWNPNINDVDPEPLFTPRSAPVRLVPKILNRSRVPRVTQPIREEDKDPVYKYLESMMTCARVREFNSRPPPEVTIEPKIPDAPSPNTTAKQQKMTIENLPKTYDRRFPTVKNAAEKTSEGTTSDEMEARKQIQIQSGCKWGKDQRLVLQGLYQRMSQNKLSERFCIGPYHIRPIARVFMRKPSGSIVTYRVHISKPSTASDNDGDDFDDSDDDANKGLDGDIDAEEEDDHTEEPEMEFGVTPFLSGVLPAGELRARTKPVGCQAYGLVQVNGKSYNQARLLLGNIGSLHPANRLAAYVTGRLHAPADVYIKNSQKSDPTNKINTPDSLQIKTSGTVVPPTVTARKTTELKAATQPTVQPFQSESWRRGSITSSSPVSLTVSPSLKTPSFLGQSGTYSFRICPPANQGTRDQNLPGVSLPGGFTLIQLPKPGADGAAQQSESTSTRNMAQVDEAPPTKDALFNCGHIPVDPDANWLGLDTFTQTKNLLVSRSAELESPSQLACDEKMPSDESDEANGRKVDSSLDIDSDDLVSDSSDYCGEVDEDEDEVDIETVEEVRQGMIIAKMKKAAGKALKGDSRGDFGSARELSIQHQIDDNHDESKGNIRRKKHTALERQRRSEQRTLFDKLQSVLQTDPRAPRLRLLSLAVKEIENLVETSRYLEEKKRRLNRMQSLYLKELSLLSGKSDKVIKEKLKEICDRQKMREKTMKWSPFFSNLLHFRAALLQTTNSKVQPEPILQPDFCMAPSQAVSVDQTPMSTPPSLPQAVSSPAQPKVTAPSPIVANKPSEPGAPAQLSMSSSQMEFEPQVPSDTAESKVTTAYKEVSPLSSTPNSTNPSGFPTKALTLPLIRSKTGRIILPSCLKPTAQGCYTIMVMNPNQKGEDSEVRHPDEDSCKNQETSFSKSERPSDSESSHILNEDKTVQSSDNLPKCSGVAAPLAELALLNKSIFVPPMGLQPVEKSQEGGAVVGLNKTLASAGLSFNRVYQIPTSVKLETDPSPPVVRRGRGRPRKNPTTPVSENRKRAVVEYSRKGVSQSETLTLDKEKQSEKITPEETKKQSEKITLEVTKNIVGIVSDSPVPVKRGRGRPPKSKPVQLWSPRAMRPGRCPAKSTQDKPVRPNHSLKSPDTKPRESPTTSTFLGDVNTSRPLTRGALGKDFPSAKKRSWIDMEKELEPELEFE